MPRWRRPWCAWWEAFLRPGDSELDVARRYRAVAEELRPLLGGMLEHHLTQHLRQAIRAEVLTHAQIASGATPAHEVVAVAFADLSGFTRIGARVPADEVGRVAGRFVALTAEILVVPVRAVSTRATPPCWCRPSPQRCSTPCCASPRRWTPRATSCPAPRRRRLRAGGLECGDWFGHTVNLASRIAEIARASTVVGDTGLRGATSEPSCGPAATPPSAWHPRAGGAPPAARSP